MKLLTLNDLIQLKQSTIFDNLNEYKIPSKSLQTRLKKNLKKFYYKLQYYPTKDIVLLYNSKNNLIINFSLEDYKINEYYYPFLDKIITYKYSNQLQYKYFYEKTNLYIYNIKNKLIEKHYLYNKSIYLNNNIYFIKNGSNEIFFNYKLKNNLIYIQNKGNRFYHEYIYNKIHITIYKLIFF